jgi:hypothetical protein
MGALWFDAGQLADHLHELVGYKAGVAVSLQELCDLQVGLIKMAVGEPRQRLVQPFIDGADGTGREAVTTEFFGDGLDLPGGDTLHVHLRQHRDQRFLAPRVALEQGR